MCKLMFFNSHYFFLIVVFDLFFSSLSGTLLMCILVHLKFPTFL